MKDPEIGLALIWRYFFEVFNFLKKRDFEKPDFPNFSEMICFWQKIDATGQRKMIIPKTRRIQNFLNRFCFDDNMTVLDETITFQKIPKVAGYTIIWRYFFTLGGSFRCLNHKTKQVGYGIRPALFYT